MNGTVAQTGHLYIELKGGQISMHLSLAITIQNSQFHGKDKGVKHGGEGGEVGIGYTAFSRKGNFSSNGCRVLIAMYSEQKIYFLFFLI